MQTFRRLDRPPEALGDQWHAGSGGTLVWPAMAIGMRRGELCALRFSCIHFDEETIDLRRNWVGGKEKDTKTNQARRIALDSATLDLLRTRTWPRAWASRPTCTRCGTTPQRPSCSGVDLRTVAGRLGHGGGGATTLKVYAA